MSALIEQVAPAVIADLYATERAVALYASDLATGADVRDLHMLRPWIGQGIERLGRNAIRSDAQAVKDANLLLISSRQADSPAMHWAMHWVNTRFPLRRRLDWAQSMGAMSVIYDVRPIASARNAGVRNRPTPTDF